MRVAIIGSGVSGLVSMKCCKEGGFDAICYEQSDNIGGLWRYSDEVVDGMASVSKSTIINTCKELNAFSDFPPPKEFPNYMHNTFTFKYLQMYAENFQLMPDIKFHHRVENVEKCKDYDSTGRWKITVVNLKTEKEENEIFDAVFVCNGHHVFPHIPVFPGQEKFKGKITHTHSYKKPVEYEDKSVLVVGVGNSAGDTAVEISALAKKVYLSTRRGSWILKRVADDGEPYDALFTTRFLNMLFNLVPLWVSSWFMERKLNQNFNHKVYQLKPKHRFLHQHPMINDALPNKILSGTITLKRNIQRFEENGVVFEGNSEVTEIDHVILGTGYHIKFPFLSSTILDTTNNRVELYKLVYPPNLKHPTLIIIGLFQALGGSFPIDELQSRWAVQLLCKNVSFPSEKKMRKDIKIQLRKMRERYYDSKRQTVQVDYINYSDELASLFGVKPNLGKLFFTDIALFWALMKEPSLPYQYRLQGPHAWSKARETILSYRHRFHFPLQTRFKP